MLDLVIAHFHSFHGSGSIGRKTVLLDECPIMLVGLNSYLQHIILLGHPTAALKGDNNRVCIDLKGSIKKHIQIIPSLH
ncbi:hypothetical protein V6N12_026023 [Hibiscus sabdariffa]|uniref:Uncharacterized protein n=1 Tax=Hibiscus sabdariffa TaxID=183260 RepID=A0ABR2DQJ7_9ROSI